MSVVCELCEPEIRQAEIFNQTEGVEKDEIIAADEEALVLLYGGSSGKGLENLRYRRFCEKVSKSTVQVEPQTLQPTSAAAKFHSIRVTITK